MHWSRAIETKKQRSYRTSDKSLIFAHKWNKLLCLLVNFIFKNWSVPLVAKCFATDPFNAATSRVLLFVICLWCPFWNCTNCINPCCLFLSGLLLCRVYVFLDVTILLAYFTFLLQDITHVIKSFECLFGT